MSEEIRSGSNISVSTVTIPISGMTCAACVTHVESALRELPDISDVSVNLASEKAILKSNLIPPPMTQIESALDNAGYGLQTITSTIGIEGMTCSACVSHVESAVRKILGVTNVSVNLASEKARICYIPGHVTALQIRKAIENAGYTPVDSSNDDYSYSSTDKQARSVLFKSLVSISIGFFMLIMMYIGNLLNINGSWRDYLFFSLATPVQIWAAKEFYVSAWNALKRKTSNMNTLIALGTTVAFSYSTIVLIFSIFDIKIGTGHTYFDAACFITGLVLLGRHLESKARRKAASSIQSLLSLNPQEALVQKNGNQVVIPVDDVSVGMEIIVKPGAKIPVDGIVTKGISDVDEAMLTGESVPQVKSPGKNLYAATINGTGLLTYEAKAIGINTVYSKVLQLVEEAQASKAPIQKLADKIASWFVPIVLLLALLVLVVWLVVGPDPSYVYAISAAVAILVIACPCAMGLATPTAVMVGTGQSAESGILFKDAETLEVTKKITAVVFDKTGTVTDGNLKVFSVEPEYGYSEESLISLAASVESGSEHVIAKSILKEAHENSLNVETPHNFSVFPGRGAIGMVNGKNVLVGNLHFLREHDVHVEESLTEKDATEVFVAADKSLVGKILLRDNIRKEAKYTVSNLKSMGIKVLLLSGDKDGRAKHVASQVGISEVISEVPPEFKAETIKSLQKEGHFVCMVGDGINDAPALAQSNIGIAMASGTDVATESASITLVRNDLTAISNAINISHLSIRTIKQNLLWAFGYNVILIPIAAGILYPLFVSNSVPDFLSPILGMHGFLNPAIAALAMAFSSISVVLNSLRLKRTLSAKKK